MYEDFDISAYEPANKAINLSIMSVHTRTKWPKVSDYVRLCALAITSASRSCTVTAISRMV